MQAALAANPGLGVASAVAAFHAVLALGTSSGAALVLLPRGLQPDGQPSKCAHFALYTTHCCTCRAVACPTICSNVKVQVQQATSRSQAWLQSGMV